MLSDENKVCTWLIRLISRYGKGDKPSVRSAFYKLVEQGLLHAFIKPPKDFTSREPKIVQRDYTYPRVKQPWSEGVTILYQVQEDHGKWCYSKSLNRPLLKRLVREINRPLCQPFIWTQLFWRPAFPSKGYCTTLPFIGRARRLKCWRLFYTFFHPKSSPTSMGVGNISHGPKTLLSIYFFAICFRSSRKSACIEVNSLVFKPRLSVFQAAN